MDYKHTLNLPKTSFSMKANLTQLEPKILSLWEDLSLYDSLRKLREGKKKFTLHDGPPYANGLIHIGHALNKILKDIVVKYKTMRGFDSPFIVGWDCHGLPVEHQLFKELNLTKHDVGVLDFRSKAKDFALKFVDLQRQDFRRLGVLSDWDNPYLTLNPGYECRVIKLLEYLVSEGFVYRLRKPVNWCSVCETALAEAEVEYSERASDSIYVKCKVDNLAGKAKEENVYFVIWTTTPWTLLANVAIAIHPNQSYVGLKHKNGELWIVAQKLCDNFLKAVGINENELKLLWTVLGRNLEGSSYEHPLGLRQGKVVLADYVSMDEGTGCVHTAPGHGQEDFITGRKYNLEVIMPVDDKGNFDASCEEFKGINVYDANNGIIEKLKLKDKLIYAGAISHSYPHCWRCKNPIISRATFQWFLNIDHNSLRKELLAEIENVQWFPSVGRERMKAMLLERPDWCLSRQRLWGIPIPAIKCKNCDEVILDAAVLNKAAGIFKEKGSDSWFSLDIEQFLPDGFSCPRCKTKQFQKEFDILDVWFESGASFNAVVKSNPQLEFPADMYLEGSDQHRGWFQVSLIPSVAKEKIAPFRIILTHGFVVDQDARKMSKSLGNVIAPQEIIQNYGAEILRIWSAYSDYSEDVKISEVILTQLVDIYRKVRNTIRFILGNLYDFQLRENNFSFDELCEVDRFMLSKTMLFYKDIVNYYDTFSFYKVCQATFNYCNIDLSAFYLDILKDRLYTFSPNSRQRRSAQFVLYNILKVLLKLIAPIFSFTAEEAYINWDGLEGKQKSVFFATFDEEYNENWLDNELLKKWEKLLALRPEVLREIEKSRTSGVIGSSLEAEVFLRFRGDNFKFYKDSQDILREVFIVSAVRIEEGDFSVTVAKARGAKCVRCWNWRQDVGSEMPLICPRCVTALRGGTE